MNFFEDWLDEGVGRIFTVIGLVVCGGTTIAHQYANYSGTDYAETMAIGVGILCFGASMFISSLLHDRNIYLRREDKIWTYYLAILVCIIGGSSTTWLLLGEDIAMLQPIYVSVAGAVLILVLNSILRWGISCYSGLLH